MALAKAPTSHSRMKSALRSSARTAGRSSVVSGEFIGWHANGADNVRPTKSAGGVEMKRRRLLLGSLAAAAPFSPARAQAAWPAKPVRFVVPRTEERRVGKEGGAWGAV